MHPIWSRSNNAWLDSQVTTYPTEPKELMRLAWFSNDLIDEMWTVSLEILEPDSCSNVFGSESNRVGYATLDTVFNVWYFVWQDSCWEERNKATWFYPVLFRAPHISSPWGYQISEWLILHVAQLGITRIEQQHRLLQWVGSRKINLSKEG